MVEKKLKTVTKKATVKTKASGPKAHQPLVEKVSNVSKAEKKTQSKVPKGTKVERVQSALTVTLFDNKGAKKGTVKLPEAVFGAKINAVLMSQAVRVYLANQRVGNANTKTRGQVDGSTRKIYRQKGTGQARHGGIRAPIFVGGGIAHGPKRKDFSLKMSQSMRRASVLSSLSALAKDGKVTVVADVAALDPKTKHVASLLKAMDLEGKKTLLVMPEHTKKVFLAARNIENMNILPANMLNTYEVLNAGTLIVMQESLAVLEKQFAEKEAK